jgi:two-component system, OmpR family, sensor histidine kinase TctE
MTRSYSLRHRLTGVMLLVFMAGLVAAALFSHNETLQGDQGARRSGLRRQACALLAALSYSGPGTITLPEPVPNAGPANARFAFTLYDAEQRPIAWSPTLAEPLPFVQVENSDACGQVFFVGQEPRMALAVRAPNNHTLIVLHEGLGTAAITRLFLDETFEATVVFVPFAVGSIVLLWLMGGWSLRPLSRASREAAAIGPSNLSGRVTADGLPKEVQPLVEATNGAMDRLERAYFAQRRLTTDAAHELRTPLAVLSLRLQRAKLDDKLDWPAVERDLAQMDRMVTQLLAMARKEEPSRSYEGGELRVIPLSRIVREVAAAALPLAEEQGRSLEVDVQDAIAVRGNPDDLRDAVRNLIDNALAHGRGEVKVTAQREPNQVDGLAFVEVRDQGPGIPAELTESVFDRFRKVVPSSSGAGLGLAIVRHVAEAHGGAVRAYAGPGGRVRISLPTTAADPAGCARSPAAATGATLPGTVVG